MAPWDVLRSWLLREAVDIHFGARADVDLAVGDGRGNELHGVARLITVVGGHGAVPVFDRQIARVVGVKDGGPSTSRRHRHLRAICDACIGAGVAIESGVDGPDNAVGRTL